MVSKIVAKVSDTTPVFVKMVIEKSSHISRGFCFVYVDNQKIAELLLEAGKIKLHHDNYGSVPCYPEFKLPIPRSVEPLPATATGAQNKKP